MDATAAELEILERIQAIDLDTLRQQRELDELPQRAVIADARERRAQLSAKLSQIETLRHEASKKLVRIQDEDASLVKKEHGVQAAINAAQGDYRNVEARSKELVGIEKRRFALGEQKAQVEAELAKMDALSKQVRKGLEAVDATEAQATESFRQQGGALQATLASLEEQRSGLQKGVSEQLLALYDKTRDRSGGVGIGRLTGGRCGVCRAVIDSGRLIDLRNQAPLGECPSCKRLLIIEG